MLLRTCRYFTISFVLSVALLLPMLSTPAASEGETRMASLRAVTANQQATIQDRCDDCWVLFKAEEADPSPTHMGAAGGPIDSGYVQGVILGSFVEWNMDQTQREAIVAWAKEKATASQDVSSKHTDALVIIRGLAGDGAVVPQLIRIVGQHPEGYMRTLAARALGDLGDHIAIPALRKALDVDTYARVRAGHDVVADRATLVYSPVREAAGRALQRMGEEVSEQTDLVNRQHIVPRLAALLDKSDTALSGLMWLGAVGGTEAEKAIQSFIDGNSGNRAAVTFAESMLVRARQQSGRE